MPVSPTDGELFHLIDAEIDRPEYAGLDARAAWDLFHAPTSQIETYTVVPELSFESTLGALAVASRNALVSWPGYPALLAAIEGQRTRSVSWMIVDLTNAGYVKTAAERDAVLAGLSSVTRNRESRAGPSRCDQLYPTGLAITLPSGMTVSGVPLEVFEKVIAHRANSLTPANPSDETE